MNLEFHNSRRARGAFTIIELLVAVAVTALLVSLMLTIVVNVMNGWSRSSGTLTSGNQARLVLDQLSRDLQSVIIKRDSNVWFAATIQQNQPTNGGDARLTDDATWTNASKPASGTAPNATDTGDYSLYVPVSNTTVPLEDYRFGQAGVWLRFITSVPDTNVAGNLDRLSAPRAVAYQIIRLPVVFGSSETRYQLFRSEVSPTATFAAGYDLFSAAYNATSAPSSLTDAGSIRHPEVSVTSANSSAGRQLVLANNVIDFGVRVYARNTSNVLTLVYPSTTAIGFAATTNKSAVPPSPGSGSLASADFVYDFPEVVEVSVRILTDEGVQKISNLESGLIAGSWWEIALANSRVYTRRIEIKSRSL
ncbi:MAG: hypothetical protein WC205_14060 [Opitutaceae bacterium]|jgi:type II secretory pathway pseudopilin PulG